MLNFQMADLAKHDEVFRIAVLLDAVHVVDGQDVRPFIG